MGWLWDGDVRRKAWCGMVDGKHRLLTGSKRYVGGSQRSEHQEIRRPTRRREAEEQTDKYSRDAVARDQKKEDE